MTDYSNLEKRLREFQPDADYRWPLALIEEAADSIAALEGIAMDAVQKNEQQAVKFAECQRELASANRECKIRNERELAYLSRAQNAEAAIEQLNFDYAGCARWARARIRAFLAAQKEKP